MDLSLLNEILKLFIRRVRDDAGVLLFVCQPLQKGRWSFAGDYEWDLQIVKNFFQQPNDGFFILRYGEIAMIQAKIPKPLFA